MQQELRVSPSEPPPSAITPFHVAPSVMPGGTIQVAGVATQIGVPVPQGVVIVQIGAPVFPEAVIGLVHHDVSD